MVENPYRRMCFKYGVLTLCYLLDEYTREENYEECRIIYDAIVSIKKTFNIELPTTYSEAESRLWLLSTLNEANDTLAINMIIRNIPSNAEKLKKDIKDLKNI